MMAPGHTARGGHADPVRLGGVMIWVPDVRSAVRFFEEGLGLPPRWVRDEGDYAQIEIGAVTVQLADERAAPIAGVAIRLNRSEDVAPGFQLSLATEDVPAAVARAVDAGATLVAEPVMKPWGQVVAHLRDPNGVLIELAIPGD